MVVTFVVTFVIFGIACPGPSMRLRGVFGEEDALERALHDLQIRS